MNAQTEILVPAETEAEFKMVTRDVNVWYGDKQAIKAVSLDIPARGVTALIGPSGCGKSTYLRCLNRMNDTIDICRVEGDIRLDGEDIHDPVLDVVQLRARVGMVFQRPNPFPKSIFENVAYGPKIHGLTATRTDLEEVVETSLKKAGLWEEVKDRLDQPGTGLSGGQQQRLCIARANRGQSRGHPDGRAVLGAGPDRHGGDRGADGRTARKLLHGDRDPFDATGRPGFATDRLFPSRRNV